MVCLSKTAQEPSFLPTPPPKRSYTNSHPETSKTTSEPPKLIENFLHKPRCNAKILKNARELLQTHPIEPLKTQKKGHMTFLHSHASAKLLFRIHFDSNYSKIYVCTLLNAVEATYALPSQETAVAESFPILRYGLISWPDNLQTTLKVVFLKMALT